MATTTQFPDPDPTKLTLDKRNDGYLGRLRDPEKDLNL